MMACNIDAEKLIAEIKFAKSVYNNPKRVIHGVADAFRQDGRAAMCDDILKKIASLQQEQPDNEDIDKVAQELYEHLYELKRRNNVPTNLYDKQEIIDLWKAGIEYGRNHPKQEQPEVDLEKEIEMYISSKGLRDYAFLVPSIARHFWNKGYNAGKEGQK